MIISHLLFDLQIYTTHLPISLNLDDFESYSTGKIEVVRRVPQVPTHAFKHMRFSLIVQVNCPGSQLWPVPPRPLDAFPSCLVESNVPEVLLPFPYNVKIPRSPGSFSSVYKQAVISPT